MSILRKLGQGGAIALLLSLSAASQAAMLTPADLNLVYRTAGSISISADAAAIYLDGHALADGAHKDQTTYLGSYYGGPSTFSYLNHVLANNGLVEAHAIAETRAALGNIGVVVESETDWYENIAISEAYSSYYEQMLLAVPLPVDGSRLPESLSLLGSFRLEGTIGGTSAGGVNYGGYQGVGASITADIFSDYAGYHKSLSYQSFEPFGLAQGISDGPISMPIFFSMTNSSDDKYQYYRGYYEVSLAARAFEYIGLGHVSANAIHSLALSNVTLSNGDSLESGGMVLQFASGFQLPSPQAVPEPASLTLISMGAAGLFAGAIWRRRRPAETRSEQLTDR